MSTDDLLAERARTHGDFAAAAGTVAALEAAIFGPVDADPARAALWSPAMRLGMRMEIVKIARIVHGDPACAEHWDDLAGYPALVARALRGETILAGAEIQQGSVTFVQRGQVR